MFSDKHPSGKPLTFSRAFFAGCLSASLLLSAALSPSLVSAQATQSSTASQPLMSTPVLNINTAGAEEIADLMHGVGLEKAAAIVDYRTQNGPFTKVEELLNVKGVGPATLAKNEQLIKFQ